MRRKNQESKNISLGVLFIVMIIVLITVSATFKVFETVRKSTFDEKSNFYILIPKNSGWEDIVISPNQNLITILNYKTKDKSLAASSLPYDLLSSTTNYINEENIKSEITSVLKNTKVNPFDFLKVVFYVNKNSEIEVINIDASSATALKKIPQIILDPRISNENLTIEISNASGVSGVGNVFARMITNMGGSVILVSTNDKVSQKSKIQSLSSEGATVKKLIKMYGLTLDKTSPTISDIKIVVGKDLLGKIGLR